MLLMTVECHLCYKMRMNFIGRNSEAINVQHAHTVLTRRHFPDTALSSFTHLQQVLLSTPVNAVLETVCAHFVLYVGNSYNNHFYTIICMIITNVITLILRPCPHKIKYFIDKLFCLFFQSASPSSLLRSLYFPKHTSLKISYHGF